MNTLRKMILVLFAGVAGTQAAVADGVFETLSANCGKAFAGQMVSGPEDSPWRAAKLVIHIRDCSADQIKMPLHFDDNHSRILIITKIDAGLRLKHDHRHDNGHSDKVTMYGGETKGEDGGTNDASVAFYVDAESIDLFQANGNTRSQKNVWSMIVEGNTFSYGLNRPGLDFKVDFDIGKTVPTPPAAWDLVH